MTLKTSFICFRITNKQLKAKWAENLGNLLSRLSSGERHQEVITNLVMTDYDDVLVGNLIQAKLNNAELCSPFQWNNNIVYAVFYLLHKTCSIFHENDGARW